MSFPCPGRHRVTDHRNWYVPFGKTSHSCTYCEECYNTYVKNTPADTGFTVHSNLHGCNCDYPKDLSKCGVQKNDLRVTVTDAKTFTTYKMVENDLANMNGVMHVALPTCTEYTISVENLNNSPNVYFSFETGKVGDKEIIINHGQRIYYKTDLEIKGFKTGTSDSFMFISQSNQERFEGKVLEGENVTNIISLKFKKWQRHVRECYMEFYCDSTSRSRGGAESMGATKGLSKGGDSFGHSMANLSGGATVSGGSYVDSVRTSTTNDRFDQIDNEVEFLIQLVCTQPENEKYEANKKYYLKKEFEEREKLLSKKKRIEESIKSWEDQVTYYEGKLNNERKSLDELSTELKKYDHLGSTAKEDYLMHF